MIIILLLLSCLSIFADNSQYNPQYCCGPVNNGRRNANSAAVWNSPGQVQIICADDHCWVSSTTSQGFNFPGLFGVPNPDPNGLQVVYILKQLEVSLAALGLHGRNDVVHSHMICESLLVCNQTMANYGSFFSSVAIKPTLSFIGYALANAVQSTFTSIGDVVAYNKSAYNPSTGCVPLVRELNSPTVVNDPLASDGIQAGDTIYTSIMVSSNKLLTVYQQTTNALLAAESVVQQAGADRTNFVFVYVYLQNISDKVQMDSAYANFFSGISNLPAREVGGSVIFVRPQQVGSLVGIRVIAATPSTFQCSNTLSYYRVPEILHDSYSLASQAVGLGKFLYVGTTFGDTDPTNPVNSIPTDPAKQYQAALTNQEGIAAIAGADRADYVWLETDLTSPLLYTQASNGVAGFYNWTNFPPPAVTFDGPTNQYGVAFQLHGIYWKDYNNYAILPTPWPWAISGLLTDIIFGLPIGTVPNSTICSDTAMITCPKPGYFYNSYPSQYYNSLGSQFDSD